MDKLTPEQRSLHSRMAAHALHAKYDSREITKPAREGFRQRFLNEVDPERKLPEAERRRRAEHAMKSYMQKLSLKAARARTARLG